MSESPFNYDFKEGQIFDIKTGHKTTRMTATKTKSGLKLLDGNGFGHAFSISQFLYNFDRNFKLVGILKNKPKIILFNDGECKNDWSW